MEKIFLSLTWAEKIILKAPYALVFIEKNYVTTTCHENYLFCTAKRKKIVIRKKPIAPPFKLNGWSLRYSIVDF